MLGYPTELPVRDVVTHDSTYSEACAAG
jgi:hypothetical protein